jgi:hypothetical protein
MNCSCGTDGVFIRSIPVRMRSKFHKHTVDNIDLQVVFMNNTVVYLAVVSLSYRNRTNDHSHDNPSADYSAGAPKTSKG